MAWLCYQVVYEACGGDDESNMLGRRHGYEGTAWCCRCSDPRSQGRRFEGRGRMARPESFFLCPRSPTQDAGAPCIVAVRWPAVFALVSRRPDQSHMAKLSLSPRAMPCPREEEGLAQALPASRAPGAAGETGCGASCPEGDDVLSFMSCSPVDATCPPHVHHRVRAAMPQPCFLCALMNRSSTSSPASVLNSHPSPRPAKSGTRRVCPLNSA